MVELRVSHKHDDLSSTPRIPVKKTGHGDTFVILVLGRKRALPGVPW